jgi:hypothetical protein
MLRREEIGVSISPWNSPPMLVIQPDKVKAFHQKHGKDTAEALTKSQNAEEVRVLYRFTSDMRCLNSRTVLEPFPLQFIPSILNEMKDCDRFSGQDIPDAFFCVLLAILSRQYTAFSTTDGHYEYLIMPQGSKNAAAVFASIVQEAFKHLKEQEETKQVSWYQDDVINHTIGLV